MGEAKRRKESPVSQSSGAWWSKEKSQQFVALSTQGAWVGIGLMVAYWLTVRFIGPALGWWQVVN
ncbi:MAG: DUF2839 domain-containing protein [Oscillatoriales cyanobacterium SM2_2_1]|nr:DUF2839 domain-containing protein [Oscillatoriales cyanobacterium SM2_2_1]